MTELRERSERLFTDLLQAQAASPQAPPGPRRLAATSFSWFNPDDALEASTLAFRLSALSASRSRVNDSLERSLDHADEERVEAHPELVRQGLALFVTHNRTGRRLQKPRSVAAAPGMFNPPPARGGVGMAVSLGGAAPELDYWREDVLANEHHQHWHEVYPYGGLPPADFASWLTTTPRATLLAILNLVLQPGQGAAVLDNETPARIAALFAQIRPGHLRNLAAEHYQRIFHLNDRQGELFFYMHQQMLARYDAELVSHGLARVDALGPTRWDDPIVEGYDPEGFRLFGSEFTTRQQNQELNAGRVQTLTELHDEVDEAVGARKLRAAGGGTVPIDRTNLGEAVEAAAWQLTGLDRDRYPGLHNWGHGFIGELSPGEDGGVMNSTATAIRDQVFWRWHKAIDDINARWQEGEDAHDLSDGPPVVVRDVILARTLDLPDADLDATGETLFGGTRWDDDFAAASAGTGPAAFTTIDELTTTMLTTGFGGRQIKYLTHEPFTTFVRVENPSATAQSVTLRLFLVPDDHAGDRRGWIELDKFIVELPASSKVVVPRPDTESSVIKRPVDTSPNAVLAGGTDPDDESYCDCGWPYTLLLPRGNSAGLEFRLLVLCTDATVDQVPEPRECGSMSFCGAVDRYPDTRNMGYPFDRPFTGGANAIRDTFAALDNAASRTITIRHTS
jgi:hypothetical protein